MPLLVLLLVVAVVLGLTTSRRTAVLATAALAALCFAAFLRAVVDGQGEDPAWLLALPVALGAAAVWLTARLADSRARRTVA